MLHYIVSNIWLFMKPLVVPLPCFTYRTLRFMVAKLHWISLYLSLKLFTGYRVVLYALLTLSLELIVQCYDLIIINLVVRHINPFHPGTCLVTWVSAWVAVSGARVSTLVSAMVYWKCSALRKLYLSTGYYPYYCLIYLSNIHS